jgi:hypothetical protein
MNNCSENIIVSLFPEDVDNKVIVYMINIVHIMGVLLILLGIFINNKYMKYYIIYIVFLFVSYIILNDRCFMTILSNYCGNINYNLLCIKMRNAKMILSVYLIIGIILYYYPEYSLNIIIEKKI